MLSARSALALLTTAALLVAGVSLSPNVAPPAEAAPARLTAKQQSVSLTMLPQIAQQGRRARSARAAQSAMNASFRPVRNGRAAQLQQRRGNRWVTVRNGRQDARGVVNFRAPARKKGGAAHRYRAVAPRGSGMAAKRSTARSTASWRTVFDDQFSGRSLNRDKWSYRSTGERVPSRTKSSPSPKAVQQKLGSLRLQVKRSPRAPGRRYINGMVGSQGKFDFTYGVAAARIKFPRGQGQHGAFWMQPDAGKQIAGKPKRSGAEVDIVEYFGDGRPDGGLSSFLYFWNKRGQHEKVGGVWPQASQLIPRGDDWWKSYHVFSVEWTPRMYIFRVDGQELYRTRKGVSGIDQFLILSLLSSDWELPRLNKKSLPTQMYVDWVRVWKK